MSGARERPRAAVLQAWLAALRSGADEAALRRLPPLEDGEAEQLFAALRGEPADGDPPPEATEPPAQDAASDAMPARFRPALRLLTLTRADDGLLGIRPAAGGGPRASPATVATIAWQYFAADGRLAWQTPAPRSVLGRRPPARTPLADGSTLQRDLSAEADALDRLRGLGLQPLPPQALQWRAADPDRADDFWTLPREEDYGDFWADAVPPLQAEGWQVQVRPGFAHETLPVLGWRCVLRDAAGAAIGLEPAGFGAAPAPPIAALKLPRGEGSWFVSLGVEVGGETLDLQPMLIDLLKRDARWLDAGFLATLPDAAPVRLRGPAGRRLSAAAGPLKQIVAALADLLADPARRAAPLRLSHWDVARLDGLRTAPGGWQLDGGAALAVLEARLRAAGEPLDAEPPPGLGLVLRPYQRRGLAWLQLLRAHGLGGILADEMGLGKTAQALAHVLAEKAAGRLDRPALVVLPTSLLFNWQAEAARIAPSLDVLALDGPDRAALRPRIAAHDLLLTSYALVWRDIAALAAEPFHLVILDEAQTVKNPASRAAAAIRRLQARHRLCLTGTPLENHLGELWAQFDFLMPGFLGDARAFQRRFRDPIEKNGERLRAELLARRVRPFILRRRKHEVAADLPPKTEVLRPLRLAGRQRALYEGVRLAADRTLRRVLKERGFARARISVLDALLRLRQVCVDPRLVGADASVERVKTEWLRDTLPALVAEGRTVVVFSQFAQMLGLVAQELPALGLQAAMLTGDTPARRRGEVVGSFQRGEVPLLLASLKAGGLGLNLTAADTVVHLDPWWNPAVEAQATDRAHRIGQHRPVLVYRLIVAGSIEERMLAWQQRKQGLAEGILGRDDAAAPKFDLAELEWLLAPLEASVSAAVADER